MELESNDAWWRACCIVSMIQNANCTEAENCKDPAHFFELYRGKESRQTRQRQDEIIAARRRRADGDRNPDEQQE